MSAIAFDTLSSAKHMKSKGMKADFKHLEASLRELELRMTIKMGTMLVALVGFIKYFIH